VNEEKELPVEIEEQEKRIMPASWAGFLDRQKS
jgi:hypothetical protein